MSSFVFIAAICATTCTTGRQEFHRGLRCAGGGFLLESHGQTLEWLKGKFLCNVTMTLEDLEV